MPSLKEIARQANTSVTTVSLVLNGRDGPARISLATRRQVLEAARSLGYTPNIAARRLRSASGAPPPTVGILMPFDERLPITVRNVGTIRAALDAWAREQRTVPPDVLIETYPGGRLAEVRSLADNTRYNGAILFNTLPEDDRFLANSGPLALPLVLVQRTVAGHGWVNVDNRRIGERVVDHLHALGHRRFAMILPDVPSWALQERHAGFVGALRDRYGIALSAGRIEGGAFSERGGYEAAARLLARQPPTERERATALYVAADLMAVGVLHALKEAGLRVPQDVAVVGTDDDHAAPFLDPPLTTVDASIRRLAERASALLLDRIRDRDAAPRTEILESRLVVRRSCGAITTA